jgi:signal transduction histidine kinase
LIKEILNNIIKHAKAEKIKVELQYNDSLLSTTISHNGKGISMQNVKEFSESGRGIGLKSILSRAQLTNSVIQYLIIGSHEARITVETPVKEMPVIKPAHE